MSDAVIPEEWGFSRVETVLAEALLVTMADKVALAEFREALLGEKQKRQEEVAV